MMFVSKRCNLRSRKTHFFTADFLRLLVRKNPRQLKQGMSFFRRNSIAITHHKILKPRFVHRVNQTVRLFKQCFIRHFPPPFATLKQIIACAITNRNHCHADAFATACFCTQGSPCYQVFFKNSRQEARCSLAIGSFTLGKSLQFCNGLLLRWDARCSFAMRVLCARVAIAIPLRRPQADLRQTYYFHCQTQTVLCFQIVFLRRRQDT